MPLAEMRLPRRRSIVSSRPSTTGPAGMRVVISKPSSKRDAARLLPPDRAVEHAMVVDEAPLPAQPHDPQQARHGALARGQDRADQQHPSVVPGSLLQEQRREG